MASDDALARLPSRGWVAGPSPLQALDGLGRHLGLASLTVKQDDQLSGLYGGTKVRKLDVLTALEPFRDAPRLASVGALGSGHLATCALAAQALGRTLDAHVFFEAPSLGVIENLASLVSGPVTLHVYGSRLELALRRPGALLAPGDHGAVVIPAGGTTPAAVAGVARAGFELAAQIQAGLLPPPAVVYCALGTGGTAAGLALGLGLAGVATEVRAVAAVERVFVSRRRLAALMAGAARWLREQGVEADERRAVPLAVVHGQVGPGYGAPSRASLAAVEILRAEGVGLDPVYTGKAFAALLAEAHADRRPRHVLFWNTVHRGPLPHDPAWRERLPPRLARYLDGATRGSSRRRVLVGGAAALGALALNRVTGYPAVAWSGRVLAAWEAQVVAAATPVLSGVGALDGLQVAAAVDTFLLPLPPARQRDIHAVLALVEHGTGLGLRLARFTRLSPEAGEAYLQTLAARGGLLAQAVRGLRDLVLTGVYQQARTWPGLGYRGPWAAAAGADERWPEYDARRAPPGALPRGSRR